MNRDTETAIIVTLAGLATAAVLSLWGGWWLATQFAHVPDVPGGPLDTADGYFDLGAHTRTTINWWTLIVGVVLTTPTIIWWISRNTNSTHIDKIARRLPVDRGINRYRNGTGPTIGQLVRNGRTVAKRPVRMTTEDQAVVIAGPRTGKTTSIAIPAILEHQTGPLLVTSNKRDVVDVTSDAREAIGRVWLFDPQHIAGNTEPSWWWNPLATCRDVAGARKLARIWSETSREPGTKTDAFFDPSGQELLAGMLLAAATGGKPITAVLGWLAEPILTEPAQILATRPEFAEIARTITTAAAQPDKQRSGVYATASRAVAFLGDPTISQWITTGHGRTTQFDPTAFATSNDTLFSLSREGGGSAAPLVTAMTAAVLHAAEQAATTMDGGRLEYPLLGVLDEAANVCPWRDLPDLYSHYGSRGILLISIVQSWAQLESAFGRDGAEKLWSASNVRVYAGGVSDTTFLKRLSDLCGNYDHQTRSTTSSRHGGSHQRSTQQRSALTVDDLAAIPPGRALVLLSATRPVIVALTPWMKQKPPEPVRQLLPTS